MLISFTCSKCQCRMEIDASAMGTEVNCPECHARALVPKMAVGPGVTLGGFKIEKLIGVGGMGEVYLAKQIVLDRYVALKVLPSQAAHSKDEIAQFLHEIRLLARLEHPNIVTAHEAGQDTGVLYLAMAYVKGESLDQHLRRKGYIPEKDALKLVRKVAKALSYAWNEHRLLHRDIKPSNILLDPHGEPRLADLGLSQSLKHRQPTGMAGLVLGTPNYMSPEQAEGRENLDFRTDMYALGATLYHMLTGQLPFEAATVEETIRKKVQEPLPDPRTFNPALTPACVTLMAKMLSREPDERHASWDELIADFDIVLAGRPAAAGAARAADYKAKISAAASESLRKKKPEETRPGALVVFLVVLAVAAVAALIWALAHNAAAPVPPPRAGPVAPPDEGAPKPPPEHRAGQERLAHNRAQFEEIKQWADQHPAEFPELRVRLDALLKRAAGTPLEEEILKELETRMAARDQTQRAALAALETNIAPLIAAGDYPGAAGAVTNYTGPFAAETVKERDARAAELIRLGEEDKRKKAAAEGAWAKLKGVCAVRVIAQDYEGALSALDRGCREAGLNPTNAPIARWQALLARCGRMREAVLASYQADAGKTVEIALLGGVESWEIRGVGAGVIQAQRTVAGRGTISRDIRYEELHAAEKYRRLEREAAPMRDVLRGLLAWQTGNIALARQHFESTNEDFGQALAEGLSGAMKQSSEAAAEKAFGLVLRKAGLTPGAEPAEDMARRIRRARFQLSDISAIRAAAAEFRQNYGGSDTAARNAAILSALEKVSTFPREVDTSVIDQAMRALAAANAGAGDLRARCRMTDDGLELDLADCAKVVQIGAIAALPLVRVNLAGTRVRDVTPLRSTPVQSLDLSGCPLQDLGQLHGTAVKDLSLVDSSVESVSDLRGLQLESLNLASNRVTNLSPLAGMPLKKLVLHGCPVENLKSLQNMLLEYLDISGCERITDLKPLRGMPLTHLRMAGTPIADLAPLKDCPLQHLYCRACPNLKDLTPLHGIPTLRGLAVDGLRLTDLGFVEGLPLEFLSAQDNPLLRVLLPLKGMPLKTLRLSRTGIANLAPLAGMPLTNLAVNACENLTDLHPLMECPNLITLVAARSLIRPYLREHPALKEIGATPETLYPVAEVWRMMDAVEGRRPPPDAPASVPKRPVPTVEPKPAPAGP